MADLEENLRTFLLADTTLKGLVGSQVYVNELHQNPGDCIFLQQTGSSDDGALDDSAGAPTRYRFTLEAISLNQWKMRAIVSRAQSILNKHRGTVGDQTVKGIFAAEQDDEYIPRGVADLSTFKVGALQVEVIP